MLIDNDCISHEFGIQLTYQYSFILFAERCKLIYFTLIQFQKALQNL